MSIIDTYGDFELPEEKQKIEIIENPLQTLVSCYEAFKLVNKDIVSKHMWYENNLSEIVFNNTVHLFEGKENLKLNEKDILEITKLIKSNILKAEKLDGTGLFLSAMMNQTQIDRIFIDGFPLLDYLGYKLKPNKTIILGKQERVYYLGKETEGNVINNGKVEYQFSTFAEGGIQINNGKSAYFALQTTHGIQINNGELSPFASLFNGNIIHLADVLYSGLTGSVLLLKNKIAELDFIKTEDYENAVKKLYSFDLDKYWREIRDISLEIKRKYGK